MAKKINCKHGLDRMQELEARKIKRKLLDKDEATKKLIMQKYLLWQSNKCGVSFLYWLKNDNIIIFSALMRIENWQKLIFDHEVSVA